MTQAVESQANDSRARAWETAPAAQLRLAVRRFVWGEPDLFLSADDLMDCLSGKHGRVVANRFASVLSSGVQITLDGADQDGLSFLHSCVFRGRLDLLDRLFCVAESTLREVLALDKRGWMTHLATIDGVNRTAWSLFLLAGHAPEARPVLELAVKHFPDHPDIAKVIALGGSEASILAEIVMNRHVDAASAQAHEHAPAHSPVTRPASRRSQGV